MKRRSIPLVLPALVLAALVLMASARHAPRVEFVDFGKTVTPTQPAYRAAVPPVSDASIKEFRIPITHATIQIADGVSYAGWTFGGTATTRIRLTVPRGIPASPW